MGKEKKKKKENRVLCGAQTGKAATAMMLNEDNADKNKLRVGKRENKRVQ